MRLPVLLCVALLALPLRAEDAPTFDYYTLAVSLTPAFCDLTPERRNSVQCRQRPALSVHGLWPEKAAGKAPAFCRGAPFAPLPAAEDKALRRLMPDTGLQKHQWEKHGRCSGLSAPEYFRQLQRAYEGIRWPEALSVQGRDVVMERDVLLRELQRLNPGFPPRGIVLRCSGRDRPPLLTEIRLCLSPEGAPTACQANYRPNCPLALRLRAR